MPQVGVATVGLRLWVYRTVGLEFCVTLGELIKPYSPELEMGQGQGGMLHF